MHWGGKHMNGNTGDISRKTKKFEDIRKKKEFTSIELDKVTFKPKN